MPRPPRNPQKISNNPNGRLNFDPHEEIVEIKADRHHVRQTLQAKKDALGLTAEQAAKREAFIKKLAATREMFGLGAPGGDMIGAPYEYTKNNTYRTDFETFGMYSVTTDDGKLALALCEYLASGDTLDKPMEETTRDLMGKYYECVWREDEVNGGWGWQFKKDAQAVQKTGIMPELPTSSSWGNGAPMRVAGAIAAARTPVEAMLLAERSALASHAEPSAVEGAMAVAVTGWLLMHGYSKSYTRAFCRTTFKRLQWDTTIEDYRKLNKSREAIGSDRAWDTVQIALDAIWRGDDTYEGDVKYAVSAGGDSDTIGAMAGGVAEAVYGIPEETKVHIMDGLDNIELRRAITFDAFAARRQMELEWREQNKDRIVCGQLPRKVYEDRLQEMLDEEALKKVFGDELPEALKDLRDRFTEALNEAESDTNRNLNTRGFAYEHLDGVVRPRLAALWELYEAMDKKIVDEYDADAIDKLNVLNEVIVAAEGLSKAPVDPVRDIHNDVYDALGKRLDEVSLDLLTMRMDARVPPAGLTDEQKKHYVVIEPDTKEYQLGKLAEQALRNLQTAVAKDCFEQKGDLALEELKNGKDLAALFLYQHIQHQKSIAEMNPDLAQKPDDKRAIAKAVSEAKECMQAFYNGDLDALLETVKRDAKFASFVSGLNADGLNDVMQSRDGMRLMYRDLADPARNGRSPKADEKLLKSIGLRSMDTLQARAAENQVRTERKFAGIEFAAETRSADEDTQWRETDEKLEKYIAFGEKTASYYKADLKIVADGMQALFPEKTERELNALPPAEKAKEDRLNKLMKDLGDELQRVQAAETQNARYIAAMDATDTLNEISERLMEKLIDMPGAGDANLMKQISHLNRLSSALDRVGEAEDDLPSDPERQELYNGLDYARNFAVTKVEKHTKGKTYRELAELVRDSTAAMQETIKEDVAAGKKDPADPAILKNILSAVFLHQQVEHNLMFTELQPNPKDSPAKKAAMKTATKFLEKFRGLGVTKSLEQLKEDEAFQALAENLDALSLSAVLKNPAAMLKAYQNERVKLQNRQQVLNQGAPANEATNAKAKDTASAVPQNGQPGLGGKKP